MRSYLKFTLATALLIAVLEVLAVAAPNSSAQAALVAPCDMRLRVELTPDVPAPLDPGFISSLLGNHPDYQLTVRQEDPNDSSVVALDLTGPGPEAGCRDVVASMRKDARVTAIEVQPTRGMQPAGAVQPKGTGHAGVDGDWILEPLKGVSYTQQASDRYECDIRAADQTGYDPMRDDGGVPPQAEPEKRAEYLRAEAACFQSRGYVLN